MHNSQIKVYKPADKLSGDLLLPMQNHGTKIVEIVTTKESLAGVDGLITQSPNLTIGIKTADCAPIVFYQAGQVGIVHAGWRGLAEGIIEKMLVRFTRPQIYVGPLLPVFEIQKDHCYQRIIKRFDGQFLIQKEDEIYFQFSEAIRSLVPTAHFDPRSTFEDLSLASWRRDRDQRRNITTVRL
jgi:copper oxidase (laccase) domain-containing protein